MNSISVKVCGITNSEDAELAIKLGAEKLGFILYENSPRKIKLNEVENLKKELQLNPKQMVAVEVIPEINFVKKMLDHGFEKFQFHFPYDFSRKQIEEWTNLVGSEDLWLAPRLPTGVNFPEEILPLANTFLVDAYEEEKFGGTGKCSDWKSFSKWKKAYSDKNWILAGGLSEKNIEIALKDSQAEIIDVNSGIERLPGVKDHSKLRNFFKIIS